jgi:hypothetical protein
LLQTERNLEAIKKQASSQGAEYARLMKEKESLQRQYVFFFCVRLFLIYRLLVFMILTFCAML